MNEDRLRLLTRDLRTDFPRSPRETLGGYVIAARILDKCRAHLLGCNGEYNFDCLMDMRFFSFTGIGADALRQQVATGADDGEMAEWITRNARSRPRIEIIRWNNEMREMTLSDLPDEAQEFMEEYIVRHVPRNRPIYRWFDVYDLEEQRI